MLPAEEMPDEPSSPWSGHWLFYNPGTQPCNTLIQIGGFGTNVSITNHTNGTACKLNSLPESGYLEIDSKLGRVTWVHGDDRDLFFEYHNEGYITLDSYLPREFQVDASYTQGSDEVGFYAFPATEKLIGKYILLGDSWHKIVSASEEASTVEIDTNMQTTGAELTKIVTMNDIEVTGTNLSLNRLTIDYSPIIV